MKGDNCSFRRVANKSGKVTPSNPSPNSFMRQSERKPSRTRSPRGKSPSGTMSRRFGEKCSFAHRQVDEQPTKRSKTNNDKSAVAMLKKGNWQESVTDGCDDRPGKPGKRRVIRSWDKIHLNVSFLMHGNWVAYFRT